MPLLLHTILDPFGFLLLVTSIETPSNYCVYYDSCYKVRHLISFNLCNVVIFTFVFPLQLGVKLVCFGHP